MKDWKYYSICQAEFHSLSTLQSEMRNEINNQRLTLPEREAKFSAVKDKARETIKVRNKPYLEEQSRLKEEFWHDARVELAYTSLLNGEGTRLLEAKAWEDGHANGFSEVYSHLQDLSDFVVRILETVEQEDSNEANR